MSSVSVCALSDHKRHWKSIGFAAAERTGAGVLVVALSPILLAIWVVILVLSRRSPLIAHKRVGQDGSELWLLKFRTMWKPTTALRLCDALAVEYIDDEIGPSRKRRDDPRVWNRFARFCRRHSLDELPQLLNVTSGEMSFVGPRPVTPVELTEIYGSRAGEVLTAKPGLSGLWQISGRNRLSAKERCRLDLEYVRNKSVGMYFRVMVRTLPELLTGESAW